jgi:hypothetical protein
VCECGRPAGLEWGCTRVLFAGCACEVKQSQLEWRACASVARTPLARFLLSDSAAAVQRQCRVRKSNILFHSCGKTAEDVWMLGQTAAADAVRAEVRAASGRCGDRSAAVECGLATAPVAAAQEQDAKVLPLQPACMHTLCFGLSSFRLPCVLRCRACVFWCARCRPATPVGAPFGWRGCRQWWLVAAHQGPAVQQQAPSGHAEAPSERLVYIEGQL